MDEETKDKLVKIKECLSKPVYSRFSLNVSNDEKIKEYQPIPVEDRVPSKQDNFTPEYIKSKLDKLEEIEPSFLLKLNPGIHVKYILNTGKFVNGGIMNHVDDVNKYVVILCSHNINGKRTNYTWSVQIENILQAYVDPIKLNLNKNDLKLRTRLGTYYRLTTYFNNPELDAPYVAYNIYTGEIFSRKNLKDFVKGLNVRKDINIKSITSKDIEDIMTDFTLEKQLLSLLLGTYVITQSSDIKQIRQSVYKLFNKKK
jgi:hypothetical protein